MEDLEKVDLGYSKLRFITSEAKRLHQAHEAESRHSLQKTFEDVHRAVKRAGPAYHLISGFDNATTCNVAESVAPMSPKQKQSNGISRVQSVMRRRLAKMLALRTFKDMTACREDFREMCQSLDISVPAHEIDPTVPEGQGEEYGEEYGDINCGKVSPTSLCSQSTAASETAAPWPSEESEGGDGNYEQQ
jgi:hypothetical protein